MPGNYAEPRETPRAAIPAAGTGPIRERAENRARELPPVRTAELQPGEIDRLLHELQVHQIELEMQNEELRLMQQELEASRARYFDLYDLAPVGYLTINESATILEANLAAAGMLGVPRNRLLRRRLSAFFAPEGMDTWYSLKRALSDPAQNRTCNLQVRRDDGTQPWIQLDAAVAQGEPDRDPQWRVTMTDITERVLAEQERIRLHDQLAQAQKMESIGRLAGGVAHDFNNMLGVILGNAELALAETDLPRPVQEFLEEIQKVARHSADLTRQLLGFARRQPISPRPLDLNEAVARSLLMVRRLIGEDINLEWKPCESPCPVKMDPIQIDQILANLAANSRDAMRGSGTVTRVHRQDRHRRDGLA